MLCVRVSVIWVLEFRVSLVPLAGGLENEPLVHEHPVLKIVERKLALRIVLLDDVQQNRVRFPEHWKLIQKLEDEG